MSNMNGLACPPNPPSLPSWTFKLFKDNNWQSSSMSFSTKDYTAQDRQSISGTGMQDAATYVAYNLPVGTVVTLMDNMVSLKSGDSVGNLSGAGRCVDLVGTGKTEGLSLIDCNMNDCVSCFFWRNVDMNLGAVVLFENVNYGGNRSILFLSEWPSYSLISIAGWYLDDKLSSINWSNLADRQQVYFYDNTDGSGSSYTNVKGWGSFKEISDLGQVGFNDRMSAFQWTGLAPVKEVIEPVNMNLTFSAGDSESLSQTTDYTNQSSVSQTFVASFSDSQSQTLTVTSTETVVTGFELTYTESWKISESAGDVGAEEGGSLSLKLSQSYTNSQSTTKSQTTTVELAFSEDVTAAANCVTHATLIAKLGTVEPTSYTTIAHRWYDQPVTGAVQDSSNNNWWKRDETITGQVSGGLAGQTQVDVTTSSLT